MLNTVNKGLASSAVAVGMVLAASAASQAGDAFDPAKPVAKPAAAVPWVDVNEAIRFGDAFGDRGTGPQGTFGTFPANFVTPVHTHTNAYHAIVVQGEMTNPFGADGEANPPRMGPGSYWYVPAGMAHATACVSDEPCMFYMHAGSFFDFTPVE
jgi:mannose-6-phosphate isomerase-like protein (cupin superfamily)